MSQITKDEQIKALEKQLKSATENLQKVQGELVKIHERLVRWQDWAICELQGDEGLLGSDIFEYMTKKIQQMKNKLEAKKL